MDVSKREHGSLRAARTAKGIGARSLVLLRDIERTVETLELDITLLQDVVHAATELNAELKKNPPTKLESAEPIVDTLRQGVSVAAGVYRTAKQKVAQIEASPDFREEDDVIDSCHRFLEVVADVHDTLQELAERVEELDADSEQPLPGKSANIKDLTAALKRDPSH